MEIISADDFCKFLKQDKTKVLGLTKRGSKEREILDDLSNEVPEIAFAHCSDPKLVPVPASVRENSLIIYKNF